MIFLTSFFFVAGGICFGIYQGNRETTIAEDEWALELKRQAARQKAVEDEDWQEVREKMRMKGSYQK